MVGFWLYVLWKPNVIGKNVVWRFGTFFFISSTNITIYWVWFTQFLLNFVVIQAVFDMIKNKSSFEIVRACLARIFRHQTWLWKTMKPLPDMHSLDSSWRRTSDWGNLTRLALSIHIILDFTMKNYKTKHDKIRFYYIDWFRHFYEKRGSNFPCVCMKRNQISDLMLLFCHKHMASGSGFKIQVWYSLIKHGSVHVCGVRECPDSNVHGANMGPIWGRQDSGEPHVGPMNLAIWVD